MFESATEVGRRRRRKCINQSTARGRFTHVKPTGRSSFESTCTRTIVSTPVMQLDRTKKSIAIEFYKPEILSFVVLWLELLRCFPFSCRRFRYSTLHVCVLRIFCGAWRFFHNYGCRGCRSTLLWTVAVGGS